MEAYTSTLGLLTYLVLTDMSSYCAWIPFEGVPGFLACFLLYGWWHDRKWRSVLYTIKWQSFTLFMWKIEEQKDAFSAAQCPCKAYTFTSVRNVLEPEISPLGPTRDLETGGGGEREIWSPSPSLKSHTSVYNIYKKIMYVCTA